MILGLLVGAAWFILFVFGQLLVARMVVPAARPKAMQRIFLCGLVGVPLSLAPAAIWLSGSELAHGGWAMATLWGVLTDLGLFVLYMPFYYTVAASLSVRTIILLSRQPERALPLAAVRERFVSNSLVGQRLQTMQQNGFLMETPRGYALAPKGRLVAVFFSALKRLWNLGAGG